ncbi:MAG: metallopeptidase TldD-related protein [Clostridium sp.]|uniref:metallopeptidase TldD-related protein n=1 Tax=Clostridium sp. TaxID=1506 RepID=UPI002A9003B3|nr:metallopeptidase TldD-related protein [Clostridium sp.]MDY5099291.1 metallopeptidase TldD-related protein [Clostridium sp.]
MNKELIRINDKETAVQISNNSIKAIRNKDIVKVGARVYSNGLIGVYGQYGDDKIDDIFGKAESNLKLNIKYPCEVSKGITINIKDEIVKIDDTILNKVEDFVEELGALVKELGFVASGTISISEEEVKITNDYDLNCVMSKKGLIIMVILKEIGTANIFDTGYLLNAKEFDKDLMLKEISDICRAHKNFVDVPVNEEGKVRCIFTEDSDILKFFINELRGEKIGTKSSFFNNKFGEKLFDEKFTLYLENNVDEGGVPFDYEGTLIKGKEEALVENGVLQMGYADKRTAEKYGLKNTGSGFGDFNGVPELMAPNLTLKRGEKTLVDLLDGKPSILVVECGGGDFTSDGGYGTPIQVAYVFDGKNFIGRIPEISVKSNIYDMYGKDFIGVPKDNLNPVSLSKLAVIDMKVN